MPRKKHTVVTSVLLLFALLLSGCAGAIEDNMGAASSNPVDEPVVSVSGPSMPETPVNSQEEYQVPAATVLELPVIGATGYASIEMELKQEKDPNSGAIYTIPAGMGFTIAGEEGEWWYITVEDASGWVESKACFINLPDVIPSIIYDNTNTYSSLFVSSGREIPGITRCQLYQGKTYNPRLGREEFIVAVLYPMAKKIHLAQQNALANGDCLKMYEGYRPLNVQIIVSSALNELAETDTVVMDGINTKPWSIDWFIATKASNHQIGYAIDVTLVRIDASTTETFGSYPVTSVTTFTQYEMPTQMHELSMAAATYTYPVPAKTDAWRTAHLASTMNDPAILLQNYCTDAGLFPLASEWWHFNDVEAFNALGEKTGVGEFYLRDVHSLPLPTG